MNREYYHYPAVLALAIAAALGAATIVIPNWARPSQSYGGIGAPLTWTVTCSSQKLDPSDRNKYQCSNALPLVGGEWVSNGEGAGAYIEVQFPKEVDLQSVRLYDRGDAYQSIVDGHMDFFDGSRYPPADSNGSSAGIAALSNPALPNATIVLPEPKRTLGFRFVVDAVTSTTTEVGLAEIAPQFTVPSNARSRPRRLVGTVGVAYHDIDGLLPLGPAMGPTATQRLQIQGDEQAPQTRAAAEPESTRLLVDSAVPSPPSGVFSSRARNTQWMQYRLTAKGGDVLIFSIPVILVYESQSGNADAVAAVSAIRLFADTEPSMRHKIAIGPKGGVSPGRDGRARVDFSSAPLRISENTSVYIILQADIGAVSSDVLRSAAGIDWGTDSIAVDDYQNARPGGYAIDARDASSGAAISLAAINDSGKVGGRVVGSKAHLIVPAVLTVEAVEGHPNEFSGGRIDEPVLRFRLRAGDLSIRIKTLEFLGIGSCNDGMKKVGRSRLVEVNGSEISDIAVWENIAPTNLLYSTYRHAPIQLYRGQSKEFELRMDTQCERGQTLQLHIGGTQTYTSARETASGIQWFMPFMTAAMAVDLTAIPGLPLKGPVLSAGDNMSGDTSTILTLSPDTTLACTQIDPDRSSYPFVIESVGMLPRNSTRADKNATLVVQMKNRSDVGMGYDLAVDWGDGNTVIVPSSQAIPGNGQHRMTAQHVFSAAPAAEGWNVLLGLRGIDGNQASARYSCPVKVEPSPKGSPAVLGPRSVAMAPVVIAPDDPTSVGITFDQVEPIRSLELTLEGGSAQERVSATVFVAQSDGVYQQLEAGQLQQSWQQNTMRVQFPNGAIAKSIKLRIVVGKNAGQALTISNIASALSVYADTGS